MVQTENHGRLRNAKTGKGGSTTTSAAILSRNRRREATARSGAA
jgi:hypothetical protein